MSDLKDDPKIKHERLLKEFNDAADDLLMNFRKAYTPSETLMFIAILHSKTILAVVEDAFDVAVDHHAHVVKGILAQHKAS